MEPNIRTVLLAEDDPRDVELTLGALEDGGLANRVVVVNNGVEVLDYLRHEGEYKLRGGGDPAVVLLDIKMPLMNGIEVLREIRLDANLKYLPVVILSSSREESDLIASYSLGVNAYVVKPVDFNEFAAAVKMVGQFWVIVNELPGGTAAGICE